MATTPQELARKYPTRAAQNKLTELLQQGASPEEAERGLAISAMRAQTRLGGEEEPVARTLGVSVEGLRELTSLVRHPEGVAREGVQEASREAFSADVRAPAGQQQAPAAGPVGEAAGGVSRAVETGIGQGVQQLGQTFLPGVFGEQGALSGLQQLGQLLSGQSLDAVATPTVGEQSETPVGDPVVQSLRMLGAGASRLHPAARAGDEASLLQGVAPSVLPQDEHEELPAILQALERVGGGAGQALPTLIPVPGLSGGSVAGQGALRTGATQAGLGVAEGAAVEGGFQLADILGLGGVTTGREALDPSRLTEIGGAALGSGIFRGGTAAIGQTVGNIRLRRQELAATEAMLEQRAAAEAADPEISAQLERVRALRQQVDELADRPLEAERPDLELPGRAPEEQARFRRMMEIANELEAPDNPPTAQHVVEAAEVSSVRQEMGMRPDGPEPTSQPKWGDLESQEAAGRDMSERLNTDPEVTRPPTPAERANGMKDVTEVEPVTPDLPPDIRRGLWARTRSQVVNNFRQTQEYISDRRGMAGELKNLTEEANKTQRQLMKRLSLDQRRVVDDVHRGRRPIEDLPEEVRAPLKRIFGETRARSNELEQLGVITRAQREAIEEAEGAYIRRQYLAFMMGKKHKPTDEVIRGAKKWLIDHGGHTDQTAGEALRDMRAGKGVSVRLPGEKGPVSIDAGALKRRKNIPKPIREFLGEIDDGVFNAINTLTNTARMAEEAKFYRKVHENLDFHKAASPDEVENLATRLGAVSDEQKAILGPLYNAEVPRWMSDEIAGRIALDKIQRDIGDEAIGLFRFNKVLLRPGSYLRNFRTNPTFAFNAGFFPWDWPTVGRAAREIINSGPKYKEMLQKGGLRTEFFQFDRIEGLEQLVRDLEASKDPMAVARTFLHRARDAQRSLGEAYDFMDQVWKLAIYMKATEKGINTGRVTNYFGGANGQPQRSGIASFNKRRVLSPEEAVAHVNHYMPNYNELAHVWQVVRGREGGPLARKLGPMLVNPFISFPVERTRVHANALRNKPLTASMNVATTIATHRYMWLIAGVAGLSQIESLRENKPGYYRYPARMEAQFPFRDADGNLQYLDETWTHPMGDLLAGYRADPTKATWENAATAVMHAASNQFAEGVLSPDSFGRPEETAPASERVADWAISRFAPSLTPPFGSDFQRLAESGALGEEIPEAFGVERPTDPRQTPGQAMAQTFLGLNLRSADPDKEAFARQRELGAMMRDLQRRRGEITRLLRDGKHKTAERRRRNLHKQEIRFFRWLEENQIRPVERIEEIEQELETGPISAPQRNAKLDEQSALQRLMEELEQ